MSELTIFYGLSDKDLIVYLLCWIFSVKESRKSAITLRVMQLLHAV